MKHLLYNQIAKYYDLIYSDKNYKQESEYQINLIKKHKASPGKDLLEVACGTGRYLEFYEKKYTTTGLDINSSMLEIAKTRLPKTTLIQGDMTHFDLKKHFDIITCLFSSIGYARDYKTLVKTITNFSNHLKTGGVLLVAPWVDPTQFRTEEPHMQYHEGKDIKIARMVIPKLKAPNISVMNFHWMIAKQGSPIEHIKNDLHELTMHSKQEFLDAFKNAGLKAKLIKSKPTARGLYVATKK